MCGYLFLQLLDGFVADGVKELFGGFYLFGGERHAQLLVAEDGDALEGACVVQDRELVDFIVGKDGLQHYKISKRATTEGNRLERRKLKGKNMGVSIAKKWHQSGSILYSSFL